jgi:hypothetical protein
LIDAHRPRIVAPVRRLAVLLLSCLPAQSAERLSPEAQTELGKLQPQIDKAIDRGVAYLLSIQQRDGSWSDHHPLYASGQTALCCYTLLKSGVPPTHGAVRQALDFMQNYRPRETYTAASHLMALGATGDPKQKERIQRILADLLSWQQDGFPYPNTDAHLPGHHTDIDMSCTQYGALGLRAAALAGVEVPPDAWFELLRGTMQFQTPKELVDLPVEKGRTGTGKAEVAGFTYRRNGRHPTGSMTAAGVATLLIAREALGKRLTGDLEQQSRSAVDAGLHWLRAQWSVTQNPGSPESWLYYYLYGLERVGSLLDRQVFCGHAWYLEGARAIVERQARNGSWAQRGYGDEPDTCFAILFLERATSPATGKPKRPHLHVSEGAKVEVHLRATGGDDGTPLSLWISGFSKPVLLGHEDSPVGGLRIVRVEYLIDGQVVATLPGAPARAWRQERYAIQHPLPARKAYHVGAKVTVVAADAAKDSLEPVEVLHCKPMTIAAEGAYEPWMEEAARATATNLVPKSAPQVEASAHDGNQDAARVADGLMGTKWATGKNDATPTLTMSFAEPPKANTLTIAQGAGQRLHVGKHDRITRVRITVNGGKPVEQELGADELRPTVVDLGRTIAVRKLEIVVLARERGSAWPGVATIAEVGLELRRR